MFNRRRITAALIGLLVLVLGGWLVKDNLGGSSNSSTAPTTSAGSAAPAQGGSAVPGTDSGLPVKALSTLPTQAADTWKLIKAGGPYPTPATTTSCSRTGRSACPASNPATTTSTP